MQDLPIIDIHERDICGSVCQRCGACCRVYASIPNADSRYRKFLRATGVTVLPSAADGELDCCDTDHDIMIDLGWCRHLEIIGHADARTFRCKIYNTDEFPDLCGHYNCVAWAKYTDAYNKENDVLVHAQRALNLVREQEGASMMGTVAEGIVETSGDSNIIPPSCDKSIAWWTALWKSQAKR
jgi:hypothetical protein